MSTKTTAVVFVLYSVKNICPSYHQMNGRSLGEKEKLYGYKKEKTAGTLVGVRGGQLSSFL